MQTPLIDVPALASAISLTANVSKEVAHYLIDRDKSAPASHNLEEAIERILDGQFHKEWTRQTFIVGQSNKQQRFDFEVRLPTKRHLLIKVVKPESSSVNAAVVAHLDVKATKQSDIEQRSIYDDFVSWKAADLSLLAVGAPVLPLSAANDTLGRIGAAA